MQEFSYTVYTVVASMIGGLLTAFVAVIATALLHDFDPPVEKPVAPRADESRPYSQAA